MNMVIKNSDSQYSHWNETPYEFIDGMFVENNTNTIHKLSLMQRMIRKMNYKPRIVITNITKIL